MTRANAALMTAFVSSLALAGAAFADPAYYPYVEPGDASSLGDSDQMVITWQSVSTTPNPGAYTVRFGTNGGSLTGTATVSGRVVDNYLAADSSLPVPPNATGPRINYTAVLKGLNFRTRYAYRVTGPDFNTPFTASFTTRTKGSKLVFQVMGDEGNFPAVPNTTLLADYEARITHEMYTVSSLSVAGAPAFEQPSLALNTGDNVYTTGAEGNYRDWWFPVWNSDVASNERGAPFIRSIPLYIVAGNHDIGATGATANLLGDVGAGRFSGNTGGGDALAYFNNFYFPLNGPAGVDPQNVFNGDTGSPTGWYLSYNGTSYTSPAAIEAFRASTAVDSGSGVKRQIDTMGNYSFDSGNVHFVFLDANPHLFNGQLPGGAFYSTPTFSFSAYPSILRQWLINDLDSSAQAWKVVVFHQPSFSSGNATLRNDQMRATAKFLEDHGANLVFNGHEHNYQRSFPLRAVGTVENAPQSWGTPVVAVDQNFDGNLKTVPDGVLYLVEGAGGNRDFDDDLPNPRGGGNGIDQDDAATGSYSFGPGLTFANGPASWLDDRLTNEQMTSLYPGAGTGTKITKLFKSKVFSFAQVVVTGNSLNLYQISEPLSASSSATATNPAPYGTDYTGTPLNDPIPDTVLSAFTGEVVSAPATGTPVLLDHFTITKPNVQRSVRVTVSGPATTGAGTQQYQVTAANRGTLALNAAQLVVTLPAGCIPADTPSDTLTINGQTEVATLGRLDANTTQSATLTCAGGVGAAHAVLRSSTAQTVVASH